MRPLFIYINKLREVRVEEWETNVILKEDPLWEHIATIDPRLYLLDLLNKNAEIVAHLMR